MRISFVESSFFFLLFGLVNCSPGSGKSGDVTADQACSDYANAYCSAYANCSSFDGTLLYGSVSACVGRWKPICLSTINAPGTGFKPSVYESCAQAYASTKCDVLLSNGRPDACNVLGSLAAGAACGDDSQCATGYCKVDFFETCGACTARVGLGATCTLSRDCESGACIAPGKCIAPAEAGGDCTATVCAGTLNCVGATCQPPASLADTCILNPDPCDRDKGLSCDSATHKCVAPPPFASAGAGCFIPGDAGPGTGTPTATCTADSLCGASNTCEAAIMDGAPCSTTGANCLYPAECVSGACTLPNPSACH